jgi:hypothetical protein
MSILALEFILFGVVSTLTPYKFPRASYAIFNSLSDALPEPNTMDDTRNLGRFYQDTGLDMRYGNDTSDNPPPESATTIEHLSRLHRKQELLATLEDPYVSLRRKTILVEKEDIIPINKLLSDIRAGGLMDDWNFSEIN